MHFPNFETEVPEECEHLLIDQYDALLKSEILKRLLIRILLYVLVHNQYQNTYRFF